MQAGLRKPSALWSTWQGSLQRLSALKGTLASRDRYPPWFPGNRLQNYILPGLQGFLFVHQPLFFCFLSINFEMLLPSSTELKKLLCFTDQSIKDKLSCKLSNHKCETSKCNTKQQHCIYIYIYLFIFIYMWHLFVYMFLYI